MLARLNHLSRTVLMGAYSQQTKIVLALNRFDPVLDLQQRVKPRQSSIVHAGISIADPSIAI